MIRVQGCQFVVKPLLACQPPRAHSPHPFFGISTSSLEVMVRSLHVRNVDCTGSASNRVLGARAYIKPSGSRSLTIAVVPVRRLAGLAGREAATPAHRSTIVVVVARENRTKREQRRTG